MPNILLTGITTLDIINHLDHYPAEDSEVRAQKQNIRSGGNASNSAIVLQQLGIDTHLLANRADDTNASQVFTSLNQHQIDTSLCPINKNSTTPTSYITLNTQNGSRSIIHYRDLAELHADDFVKLNLTPYDWFHFEARNCTQLLKMLQHAQSYKKPISIELEKDRESIDSIMPYASLLLISKPFAESRGFTNAKDCIEYFSHLYSNIIITCTWGDQGAWAYSDSEIIYQKACSIDMPVETLGAGDTFNAGLIAALMKKNEISNALSSACKLAANKCKQFGFDQLIITD